MGTLQQAFENQKDTKEYSLLGQLFSSPIIRGFYKDEKPLLEVKIEGNKYEQKRMISLINTIAQNSPTGRETLNEAAKAGYTFSFERQPGSYGFCNAEDKKICLNPMINDDKLVATLTHEARHAQQHINGVPKAFCTLDVASELKLRRATEADAQAVAAQTALEIRASTKDSKVWNAFEDTSRDIAYSVSKPVLSASLEDVVAKRDKNMRDAFKGWFNNGRIIRAYERGYLYGHLAHVDDLSKPEELKAYFAEKPFEGHKTSADILKMVCSTGKNQSYFDKDLGIMDRDERMCGICEETRNAADLFFSKREESLKKAPDNSYKNLPDQGSLFIDFMQMMRVYGDIKASDKKQMPIYAAINRLHQGR